MRGKNSSIPIHSRETISIPVPINSQLEAAIKYLKPPPSETLPPGEHNV